MSVWKSVSPWACALLILFCSTCQSGRKTVFFYPMGGGCQALTEHTLRTIPVECLRRGAVGGTAAQKCVMNSIGELCLQANVRAGACVEKCIRKAPEDFKLPL